MLDFVASAWPVVVYVLLEGSALLAVLEHNHPGDFCRCDCDVCYITASARHHEAR